MEKITEDVNNTENSFEQNFRRSLVALVIPIALQNLISAAVNSADIIMLAKVSQSAMASISLAGQISFVLSLLYMGMSIGAGILTAQYWGKKDEQTIRRILSISCMFSALVSFLFFTASIFFPAALVRIFSGDAALIEYGARYQRTIAFSYLAMSLSQMYLSVTKSMEKARFSAIVSSSCLILNIILNAVCIFVLFPGMPEKAITGVAAATVIARFAELACCVIHSLRKGNIRFSLPARDDAQKQLRKDYIRYTSPVLANYIVYGCALAAAVAIIGHVSSDMAAANAIVSVVRNLSVVLCRGISSGGSVLLGKYLGRGDIASARKIGTKLYWYSLLFGVFACAGILLTKPLVFRMVDLNAAAFGYLDMMLTVCAVYCIGKSSNSTVIGGVFTAGGDGKFGFVSDTIVMWAIVIPLGLLSAFVWRASPFVLYVVLCLDELIKFPAALIRFRQYKWLNNITRTFSREEAKATSPQHE